MISPSGMYFGSTPAIAMRSSGYLPFPGCPRAGGDGRMICFEMPNAVPRMRVSLDVASLVSVARRQIPRQIRGRASFSL